MEPSSKRLHRSRTNRLIAGVCGGLSEYFGVDVTLLRVIVVVLTLWKGWFGVVYLALWFVIPETPEPQSGDDRVQQVTKDVKETAQRVVKTMRTSAPTWEKSRYAFGVGLILIGAIALAEQYIPWKQIQWNYLWPAVIILVGLGVMFRRPKG